jgi:hypothetical protein
MLKMVFVFTLLTAGLLAHESLEANGYEREALFVFCGFLVFSWLVAIQKES